MPSLDIDQIVEMTELYENMNLAIETYLRRLSLNQEKYWQNRILMLRMIVHSSQSLPPTHANNLQTRLKNDNDAIIELGEILQLMGESLIELTEGISQCLKS